MCKSLSLTGLLGGQHLPRVERELLIANLSAVLSFDRVSRAVVIRTPCASATPEDRAGTAHRHC